MNRSAYTVISKGIILKITVLSLLISGVLGCASTAWQPVDLSTVKYPVSLMRVTLVNGDRYEVFEAEVNDIGVFGKLTDGGRFFALLEDVKNAEVNISAKENDEAGIWITIPVSIGGAVAIIRVNVRPDD